MTGALAPTMLSLAKFIEMISFGAARLPTSGPHVKNIDLSAQSFVPGAKKHAFVAFRVARLKFLSKVFLNPLVQCGELCHFALIRTAMLSLLGACALSSPWGFLDASRDANETRYHERRPQNVGGTGDSRLTTAQGEPARCGLP